MNKFIASSLSCLVVLTLTASTQAGLVISNPGGGVTTTFTATGNNGFGNPGPVVVDGFTVSGDPQATYGNAEYFLDENGSWSPPNSSFSWVATNNRAGTVTFDLGGLVSLAGGFMNYAPGEGDNPVIEALDVSMNVLESHDLAALAPINTPNGLNEGEFRGILRTEADIAFLRVGGSFILLHDLTTIAAVPVAVPEPASLAAWSLLGLIGAGAAAARRRRQRV